MDRIYCNPYNIDHYYNDSQTHQEDGQHASQPQAGQTSAEGAASGTSWSHLVPGQPYQNPNSPAQIPSPLGPDLEYLLRTPQPITVEDIIPSEVSPEPPNPQLAVEETHLRLSIKERFLAGLDNYAQGAQLKDCSATLRFSNYIRSKGNLVDRGIPLYDQLTPAEKTRLNQAIIARQGIILDRMATKETVAERFLAGLDNYAQGAQLKDCSATLPYNNYVTDEGHLQKEGRNLRLCLLPEDQERVDQALLSRRNIYNKRLAADDTVSNRFLAGLDNYARGMPLAKCAKDIRLNLYLIDDGHLQATRGQPLYNRLSRDDKVRVDQALTARRRMTSQRLAEEMDKFMAMLEPYGNGQTLRKCRKQPGLKGKASTYLTDEGGLTHKGKLLVEKLQPDQRNQVFDAIVKRQRRPKLNPQMSEPSWQWPKMLLPMPETGGMAPTAMADPMQMEATRTEAMRATTWQLTGQDVPGPSESAEPPIHYYGSEAIGSDFQHQYGLNGLIPQSAPDRLIDQGILRDTLTNIPGEVYSVYDTESSVNPTNENP
ncbi:MAG: hypothetical protein P8X74_16905 [Reinekea sp.]